MVTISSIDLGCDGIEFGITFSVTGVESTGHMNDPDNTLEASFHSMSVRISDDQIILLDTEDQAIEAIGKDLLSDASNMALDVYLDECDEGDDGE